MRAYGQPQVSRLRVHARHDDAEQGRLHRFARKLDEGDGIDRRSGGS